MGDIIKKMADQMPGGFLRLQVFLAANATISFLHNSITVKAILLFSFFSVAHKNIFVKNNEV
jgi:hypothetical protein